MISLLLLLAFLLQPHTALIDGGEHAAFIREQLLTDSYAFYDIGSDGNVNRIKEALALARANGATSIAIPYVFIVSEPGLLAEVEQAHNVGIVIYTSAGYIWTGPTDPAYLPYIETVGTYGPNGEELHFVLYSDIEIINDGCGGGECSNSLAAARLGIQ